LHIAAFRAELGVAEQQSMEGRLLIQPASNV
jgi:hypothetical protein